MSAGGTDFDINRRRCLSLPRALGRLARGSAAMALGDLLDPADLDVGDLVQAREPPAVVWYNAKVIAKEGAGVTIHYTGYPTSHDKTFEADDEAIREKISAEALRRERKGLVGVRDARALSPPLRTTLRDASPVTDHVTGVRTPVTRNPR